ncbi:MAG TPA: hypothetical protein ENI07_04315 [Desulfobacterales bacterium]|nr:hypothetical protein [Desulfobacterales bacterium]
MLYRLSEILAPEDLGASGTKIIDLTLADVISRIEVIMKTKNGNSAFEDHPAANITKLELIDGSDVLFSLTGREVQSLNFYDRGVPVDNHMTGSNGEWMRASFGLDFGRKLWDPELAFDPKKFTNPQLKITWDEDVANTSCAENSIMVIAHIFDEATPAPTGFLMTKELYTYSPSANAHEYIDLPTDYPIRKLLMGSHQEERTFTQMLAEIKLSEDNDKRVPLDVLGDELFWQIKRTYPEYIENVYMVIGTTDTEFRVTPSEDAVIIGSKTSTVAGLMLIFQNGGLAKGKCETAAETIYMMCKGYIPHGYAAIPFGDPDITENWYDVTKIGSLILRLKAGPSLGSSPTTQVIAQQLRKYAA